MNMRNCARLLLMPNMLANVDPGVDRKRKIEMHTYHTCI